MQDGFEGMLTTDEAAAELNISPLRVRQLFNKGVLKGQKIGKGKGGLIYITKESVKYRKDNPGKPGNPLKIRGVRSPKTG